MKNENIKIVLELGRGFSFFDWRVRMDSVLEAGIKKKSFELNYNGGTIWCEHLDGMGNYEEEVINKFNADISTFSRPSISSFMIINLDKTIISEQIADVIISGLLVSNKLFRKVAFVGVDKNWQKKFVKINAKGTIITFLFDYEKAKEWVFAD